MKLFLILGICFTAVCCGKQKVQFVNGPDSVHRVDFNFEKVAKFCDDRYGYMTDKSEECFQDYRNFLDIETSFNFNSVIEYCEDNFKKKKDQEKCKEDLVEILWK